MVAFHPTRSSQNHNRAAMLSQRLIVIATILPFGLVLIIVGGWVLAIGGMVVLGYAAWEYYQMFRHGGYKPSAPALILGVVILVLLRYLFQFQGMDVFLSVAVLLSMATQVVQYEAGDDTAAVDFNITLGGILYLGWLGAYLVSLRQLPDGMWWLLLVLTACWLTDGFAYLVGRKIGKHKFSKRVSPNKSLEGYIAGIIASALGSMLLALVASQFAPDVTPLKGLLLGLVIGVVTPLGDLGESMLKRGFGIKDSSHLLPGHGGVMDRIDSWLWAGAIGYYLIVWFF
jgi:phosphatidate cytidylyltransferase